MTRTYTYLPTHAQRERFIQTTQTDPNQRVQEPQRHVLVLPLPQVGALGEVALLGGDPLDEVLEGVGEGPVAQVMAEACIIFYYSNGGGGGV